MNLVPSVSTATLRGAKPVMRSVFPQYVDYLSSRQTQSDRRALRKCFEKTRDYLRDRYPSVITRDFLTAFEPLHPDRWTGHVLEQFFNEIQLLEGVERVVVLAGIQIASGVPPVYFQDSMQAVCDEIDDDDGIEKGIETIIASVNRLVERPGKKDPFRRQFYQNATHAFMPDADLTKTGLVTVKAVFVDVIRHLVYVPGDTMQGVP